MWQNFNRFVNASQAFTISLSPMAQLLMFS
jgi:hypothetical protein